jgi:RNA-directed DNA polymerase
LDGRPFDITCGQIEIGNAATFMVQRAIRYAKRTHPNKSKYWWKAKYFGKLEPNSQHQWVFGDKQNGYRLLRYTTFKIVRHVMVVGTHSPDDPKLRAYWLSRQQQKTRDLKGSLGILARRQKGYCPVCGESLSIEENLETHHIMAKKLGRPDTLDNKTLVHYLCHQQLTSQQCMT